jgi:ribosome maturation factor RimP
MTGDLHDVLSPVLAAQGLELVDVEIGAGVVRVTVDREGGVDLDGLAQANGAVSAALDRADPLPGRYHLELSSPGVERRLRTPEQFARAVGETVSVRTVPGTDGPRRVQGRLSAADATGFVVDLPDGPCRLAYGEVERARTVFEWGAKAAPSPSRGRPRASKTERVSTS